MFALYCASFTHIFCGSYATTNAIVDELVALADERGALFWKVQGMRAQGQLLALTRKAADAVQTSTSAHIAWRSTGSTAFVPFYLSYLASAYAELGQFNDAWRAGSGVRVVYGGLRHARPEGGEGAAGGVGGVMAR